jgi:uncharacterized protein YbjT (DUF2867 family)
MRIAIAGASGFVGTAVIAALSQQHQVLALTRRGPGGAASPQPSTPGVVWRRCDLFSARQTERALEGAEVGVYLVHSMLPSARLTQASFEDLDLILADNFARAAGRARLGRVLYLGGLIPDVPHLSTHLASRLEVEKTLRAGAAPVVALRAGLVIGPDSSSFRIIERLVRRLPVMALPRWTRTPTQPVALADVVELVAACVEAKHLEPESFDIGGPDVVDYARLIEGTAEALGLKRRLLSIRFFSPGLSTLWVSLITGAPRELVAPLVQSLRYPMVARDRRLQAALGIPGRGLDEMLQSALHAFPTEAPRTPRRRTLTLAARAQGPLHDVRSVQRLPLPSGFTAQRVGEEYVRWLGRALGPLLRVERDGTDCVRFYARLLKAPLLELTLAKEASTPDFQCFHLTGGLLVHTGGAQGVLEFRQVLGGCFILAAVHDFTPTLPWYVYQLTQARVHLWVMHSFGRHLARLKRAGAAHRAPLR